MSRIYIIMETSLEYIDNLILIKLPFNEDFIVLDTKSIVFKTKSYIKAKKYMLYSFMKNIEAKNNKMLNMFPK